MVRQIPPSEAVPVTERTSCESPVSCIIAIMYGRNQYLDATTHSTPSVPDPDLEPYGFGPPESESVIICTDPDPSISKQKK
jgi:hypothetical protein